MFKRTRSTDDFAEEIKVHLQLEADELQREGLSEDEARRRARIAFGNVGAAQERFYLRDRMGWFDNLVRDIRFAIRQLIKNPGFTTAILVLALGMGVSVAIFGFVDAALLEPLPYTNPSQLTSVNESSVESPRWPLSYPDYLDWQRLNQSFSSLDVYAGAGYILNTSSGAEPVQAERVSGGFFQTVGVRPMLGRDLSRRGSARWSERPASELWRLAPSFRRTARRAGPDSRPRRSGLYHHRRSAACVLFRSGRQRRVLGSAQQF